AQEFPKTTRLRQDTRGVLESLPETVYGLGTLPGFLDYRLPRFNEFLVERGIKAALNSLDILLLLQNGVNRNVVALQSLARSQSRVSRLCSMILKAVKLFAGKCRWGSGSVGASVLSQRRNRLIAETRRTQVEIQRLALC